MFLFQRVEEVMLQYDDAKGAVAAFVLQEKEKLHTYTMQEIADQTYTSKPTLVRFAKVLGYRGWKEFMQAYVEEMVYQENHKASIDVNIPFHNHSTNRQVIENIREVHMQSAKDTAYLLDCKEVEKATQILRRSQRIVVFGMRPNIYYGEIFRHNMMTIGAQVEVADIGESGLVSLSLSANDCAIIISYSGNNEDREPLQHIPCLESKGVSIISITSGGDNYLKKHSHSLLCMSSRERLYSKIATIATEESILYILNVLYSLYFKSNYNFHLQYKTENATLLERGRYASLKEMKEENT